MKVLPLLVPSVILVVALSFYFGSFNSGLSSDQSVWGAFGDYVGGILNPVLTFTTIYLLIKSLDSQNRSLDNAERQALEARDALLKQQETEGLKQFDSLFFVFTEIAANTYGRFVIRVGHNKEFLGHEGITYVSERLERTSAESKDVIAEFERLDESHHNVIYELVQAYCSIFKMILEFCPEAQRDRYISIAVSVVPVKVVHLLSMAEAYTKWPVLESTRTAGFFDKASVVGLVKHFKKLAEK